MNFNQIGDILQFGARGLAMIFMVQSAIAYFEGDTEESTNRAAWSCLCLLMAMKWV